MTASPLPQLSPLRNSTKADSAHDLAREQAQHFGIDPDSEYGQQLIKLGRKTL